MLAVKVRLLCAASRKGELLKPSPMVGPSSSPLTVTRCARPVTFVTVIRSVSLTPTSAFVGVSETVTLRCGFWCRVVVVAEAETAQTAASASTATMTNN